MTRPKVGIVVIGRNEGARLTACLDSLPRDLPTVYVDSASSDDSVARARQCGVQVVELDANSRLGAARARNSGVEALLAANPRLDYIQLLDGDCVLLAGWLDTAQDALSQAPRLAAVFGRLRERYPDRSIYNKLCDDEWNVPPGPVLACGGNAMFRVTAFMEAQGFNPDLIAGEEPDLCLRVGARGWDFACIASAMAFHDANITSFSAWWRRTKRSGFAYAEHVSIHGKQGFAAWKRQLISIVAWGSVVPVTVLAATALVPQGWHVIALVIAVACLCLQVVRVAWRKHAAGASPRFALAYGYFMLVAKYAQFAGVMSFLSRSLRRAQPSIIEYKAA